MIIDKNVLVRLCSKNMEHYKCLGYDIPKSTDARGRTTTTEGTSILVNILDLPKNSMVRIHVKCDGCGKTINEERGGINYKTYNECAKENGKYYCKSCANKLYGRKNSIKTKIKNGKSFKQWCVENDRQDILDRWDYELNECNPSEFTYSSGLECWFKCPKGIHKSELKVIRRFSNGNNKSTECKVCNSVGFVYPESFKYWSDKNTKTPYEYSYGSNYSVWWKCPDNIHNEFFRSIYASKFLSFKCPECQNSNGEYSISNYLVKNNINYENKKIYPNLIGINNGLLSYDFYLPDYNVLIEYQGEQHERPVDFDGKGKKYIERQFKKQQEHDRRKRQYAKDNGIKLLEIWYYDFENIEKILESIL